MDIAEWIDHNQHGASASDTLLAVDALRDVMALHQPRNDGVYADGSPWIACSCAENMGYPCPTVSAIADALDLRDDR